MRAAPDPEPVMDPAKLGKLPHRLYVATEHTRLSIRSVLKDRLDRHPDFQLLGELLRTGQVDALEELRHRDGRASKGHKRYYVWGRRLR